MKTLKSIFSAGNKDCTPISQGQTHNKDSEESGEVNEKDFYSEKKVSEEELKDYAKHYDHNIAYRLLKKLRKSTRNKPAIVSGATGLVVYSLGKLLSALDNSATPSHLKILVVGAIGYIVLPLDLIPALGFQMT